MSDPAADITGSGGGVHASSTLYLFMDESGDLRFHTRSSPYFILTAVAMVRPFPLDAKLNGLRYDLLERNSSLELERFHASEDRQAVRNEVFAVLQTELNRFRAYALIAEKRKTNPKLQDKATFYSKMAAILLRGIHARMDLSKVSRVIAILDSAPDKGRRKQIEGAVKVAIKAELGQRSYKVLHFSSRSCAGLRVADYCCWAIHRSWTNGDKRSLDLIRPSVRMQFDVFRNGTTAYY